MSRILLVSIVYEPDMVSTATIASRLAKELDRLGHDVAVLTSVPHYNAPVTSNRPRLVSLQDEHGIRVARCFARKDPRLSRRAVDLLVFHVLSCYAALRHFRERDVIVVVSPPLTLAIVGALAKALSGGKLIYNAQELWPDVPRDLGVITNPALLAAISWFERAVYRTADHVVPIGPRFAEVIVERGAPASRVTPIANFVDTEWIKPGPKDNELSRQWGLAAAPVVLYAGNIGLTQDFETLLAAAASLRGRGVQFLVVGGGAARRDLGRRIADLDLPNVRLEDFRPPEQVADLYALADVVAVPLKEGHDRSTTPSKIFSAMAAARPLVVCAGPDTDVAETVVTSQAGLVVAPADVDGFVDAIERILRGDPAAWSAEAAIAAARAHSPAAIARRYDDVIRSLGTGGAWSLRAGRRGRRLVKRALSSARVPQMLRPVGRHLPPRVTDALTVSGLVTVDEGARALRLLAGAGDTIANTVFWRGVDGYEPGMAPLIRRLAAGRLVFFDIGANVGLYSLLAARHGASEVHAFEPHPRIFERLEQNIEANRLAGQVRPHRMALSAEQGVTTLYVPPGPLPLEASIREDFRRVANRGEIAVETSTVDLVCEKWDLAPDVLKIDVEGADHFVIAGAARTIATSRPVLICEVLPGRQIEHVLSQLLEQGYHAFLITAHGLARRDRVEGDLTYESLNFVLVPAERLALVEAGTLGELVPVR